MPAGLFALLPVAMHPHRPLFLLLLTGLGLVTPAATAAEAPVFTYAVFNAGALARGLPLPAPAIATPGTRLSLDWTSENVLARAPGEDLVLDGESLRLALQQRGRAGDWRWSAELPLIVSGGGVLDAAIETWHEGFGLPNGGREQRPRNEALYRYERGGQVLLDVAGTQSGLGDLRLGVARCGAAGGCLHLMAQLPTGDGERLLGGGLGAATWYEQPYASADGAWSGSLALGVSGVRSDGPLAELQRPVLPFGWLSLGRRLTAHWDAGLQVYAHGAAWRDSALDPLQKAGGQLSFGLRYRDAGGRQWRMALQEDVITESSPDFSIHLALDW